MKTWLVYHLTDTGTEAKSPPHLINLVIQIWLVQGYEKAGDSPKQLGIGTDVQVALAKS